MSVSGMHSGEKGEAAGKLLEPGDMFGDYTVEKLLGKGGMGAVYLVRAPGGELYAVKVMFPDMVKKGSDYRKRFAREAEFAMKIRHDNLISVYDVGEDPETGLCYIIMEYVPGGSVADRLEREGPFPMSDAVAIAAQVAMALEVAHRHGVIHRDIKPDNIMFDADGTPKLADLGVAKFTDGAHKTTVTTTGMIIGTPAYMAPEQMMDSHHIDARADIYALGVVLYEMLTGKRPNEGSTAVELLAKAIKGEPLPDVRTMRPEISAAIAHVLSLMCAPKPEGRPATALEAAQLLQKAATGRLVLHKKPPRAADAAARKKKRTVPWSLIVGCAAVCALFAVMAASLLRRPAPPALRQPVVITNVTERTIVLTNTVERVAVVTNLVGSTPVIPTNDTLSHVAAKGNAKLLPAEGEPIVPYVSRSKLHALYRSKDRKRVFVEIPFCDGGIMGFGNPPGTLARLDEAIAVGVDIIWLNVGRSKDGVLVAGGNGDTLEALLERGKGKVLFKMHAGKLETDLVKRLDAWESVIFEVGDLDNSRVLLGAEAWGKVRSGELQIMIHLGALGKCSGVTREFSVWSRSADLKRIGIFGIPQHIESYFGWDPGEAGRTDDEAGWDKALSDGITIFRTKRPKELIAYLKRRTSSSVEVGSGDGGKNIPSAMKTLLIFLSADPKDMKWKARSPWRYVTKYPAPSGGMKWTEPAFRDSGWKRTNKPLGAGKSKEIMRIADRWSSSSLYLRHHFAWKGGKVARVEFTLYHACNVKIYLNGDLVLEKVDRNDWWEKIEIPVEAFAVALRDGDNVLAVEAQDNLGVRYFDCGLTVEVEESK